MTALRHPSYALPALLLAATAVWLAGALLARPALVLHLAAALAALALGVFIMLSRKGTALHRTLGRVWVALISLAALSSFWLTGVSEGFSVIHVLSAWTLVSVALAVHFIRKGDVMRHKRFMIGTYLGLAGAGIGALMPGRALYRVFLALLA